MDSREKLIQKLKEYFEKRNNVVMAFVFGSQAKGRAHTQSDWDIAVYFKPEIKPIEWEEESREYAEESRVWSDCMTILGTDNVDFIVLNRTPATTADTALHGIPLVIKDRHLYIEFMLRVLVEAEDFRRTAQEYADIYWRSASLTSQDTFSLNRRLVFVDGEIGVLKEYQNMTWAEYQEDHRKRRIVERTIENLMNAVIDIAKIVLASQKIEVPTTYKEMVRRVGLVTPFSQELGEKLAGWTELRNILAHEYLDYRWKPIDNFLKNYEHPFRSYLTAAKEFLNKNAPI